MKWLQIELIPTIEDAIAFFQQHFLKLANKHAPIRKFRIKNRDNPWFSKDIEYYKIRQLTASLTS